MDSPGCILRPATRDDTEQIIALVTQSLSEFGLEYSASSSESDLSDIEEVYLNRGGTFRVIEAEQGQVIGTAALLRVDDKTCKIRKMYVAQNHRRQGLGKLLIEDILEFARLLGYQTVLLETLEAMSAAIALYHKYGFTQIGGIPESPRCHIVMRKQL